MLEVSIWLAYGSWERARDQMTAAAVLGSLLAVNFSVAVVLLAAGLVWGGAWRELPTFCTWPRAQLLEAIPSVLDALVLSHWARLIGRTVSTPVYSVLFTIMCVFRFRFSFFVFRFSFPSPPSSRLSRFSDPPACPRPLDPCPPPQLS